MNKNSKVNFIYKAKSFFEITYEIFLEVKDALRPLLEKAPGAVKAGLNDIWAKRINATQRKTFYKPSDYMWAALHIGAASCLLGAAGAWAGLHAVLGGVAVATALVTAQSLGGDALIRNIFKKRTLLSYKNSNLVRTIAELKEKAALSKTPALFDFSLNKEELGKQVDVTTAPPHSRSVL